MLRSPWKARSPSRPSTPTGKGATTRPTAEVRVWQPYADIPDPILTCLRGPRALEEVNSRSSVDWAVEAFRPPPEPHGACPDPPPNSRPQTFDPDEKRVEPVWLQHFNVGAESRRPPERKEHAGKLVHSLSVWTPTDLSDLVVCFIRLAIAMFANDSNNDGLEVLASFAKEVNNCFESRKSSINQFEEQLGRKVVGILVAAWDQRCPWAMVYRVKEPNAYFLPVFNLCGFLGACIRHEMFKPNVGRLVVHLLLDQATHVEYIHGIRHILFQAKDTFWDLGESVLAHERDVAGFKRRVGNLKILTDEAHGKSLFCQTETAVTCMVGANEGGVEYQRRKLRKARDSLSRIEQLVNKHSKPLPLEPQN